MVTRIYHADPDDAVNADTEKCVYIQLEEYLVNKDLLFDCHLDLEVDTQQTHAQPI